MDLQKRQQELKTVHLTRRILYLYACVAVWFLVLLARLFYLQGLHSDYYRELADKQQLGHFDISARRGPILDRNLEELAISIPSESVFAHPGQVNEPRKTAEKLAPILGESVEKLTRLLASSRDFEYLKRKVTPKQAQQIRQLQITGVHLEEESMRIYPRKNLASHVLGFVGVDNQGLGGLEYLYNKDLRGAPVRVFLRFDARRNSFKRVVSTQQSEGNTLLLTLDRTIQEIVEQVLERTVKEARASSGTVVVMDPHNGEVLALASYPSFNPNHYGDFPETRRRNRAITGYYEPGSAFKSITLAGVLDAGLSHLNEVIDCRVGTLKLGSKVYKEAKRSYEDLTFSQVLAKSSNVGTIKLALRLGEDTQYDYIRRFGFGQKTGIELPGEEPGLIRPTLQWSKLSPGALAIGQEIGVTALQMARAYSVFANGGHLIQPHIVKRLVSPEGDVLEESKTEKVRIIKAAAARDIKTALTQVVEEGTGAAARLSHYSSAGKTGTAQKFINGHYSQRKYVASFAGFAPVKSPKLVAVVVVDEPRGVIYGGPVAGPAFQEIVERALIHLRVPQDRLQPDDTLLHMASGPESRELQSAGDISVVDEEMEEMPLEEELRTIVEEVEEARPDYDTSITLELDRVKLPDFSGMSLRDVVRRGAVLGIQLKISGTGRVVGQRPEPGRYVLRNSVCEVIFSASERDFNGTDKAGFRNP